MQIFLSVELDDRRRSRLESAVGDDMLCVRSDFVDDAPVDPAFRDCAVVFGNVPPSWIPESKALRWLQLESVGFGEYRGLDWPTLGRRIIVTNLAGFFADPVAQSALAGILAHYRGIGEAVRVREQRTWRGDPLREELKSLTGANVVLFGFGSINARLAELLSPFACRLSRFASDWTPSALDAALATADIVVCAAPETDRTVGVFDRSRLSRLRGSALFVNVGRGSAVDEAALAELLASGGLGGAVIDVTIDEPLPGSHPFWTTPNTILTQHSGGGCHDELDRKIDVFASNLRRFRAGEPLEGVVDFDRGY